MKKRIAFIHGSMVMGGAEKVLLNLLHYIDYSKYDVTLWLENERGELRGEIDEHVAVRYWGRDIHRDYHGLLSELIRDRRAAAVVKSLFYRALMHIWFNDKEKRVYYGLKSRLTPTPGPYDVAILYQGIPAIFLAFLIRLVKADKKIAWIHGDFDVVMDEEMISPYRLLYGRLDKIVCVSESTRENYLKYLPSMQDKVTVIYNLQDLQRIRRLAQESVDADFDGLTFATVGRLSPEKGQELIPEIAHRLKEMGYRFTWYVVGDGQSREAIADRIKALGLEETVILTGTKANPYPYVQNASLYVQTSYTEGFCVATFEAKILGKQVVVTEVPGMREQFPDDSAFFAQPTTESLVDAIVRAIPCAEQEPKYEAITEEFNRQQIEKIYSLIGSC